MNSDGEAADYLCPECGGRLDRDNTPARRFRCLDCGELVLKQVAEYADALERLSDRDDALGDMAETLLETGGIAP